jgi:hypothetical protein
VQYGEPHREARLTISSILLLVIFISAAALIIVAAIWRPWFGDDSAAFQAIQPQATASAGVLQAPAVTPDPNAPVGP